MVSKDGMSLKHCNPDLRNTKDVALPAVKQNGMAL